MENNVASFQIDHDRLLPGIYVSRKDKIGNETVTTFDIRIKKPNIEPCMDTSTMHTLEHLLAVYLRAHKQWADEIVYVGPMGCRTGMYVIFKGDLEPVDILDLMREAFKFMAEYDGEVPATKSRECGNYLDHNLIYTNVECAKYYNETLMNIKDENMIYPT